MKNIITFNKKISTIIDNYCKKRNTFVPRNSLYDMMSKTCMKMHGKKKRMKL